MLPPSLAALAKLPAVPLPTPSACLSPSSAAPDRTSSATRRSDIAAKACMPWRMPWPALSLSRWAKTWASEACTAAARSAHAEAAPLACCLLPRPHCSSSSSNFHAASWERGATHCASGGAERCRSSAPCFRWWSWWCWWCRWWWWWCWPCRAAGCPSCHSLCRACRRASSCAVCSCTSCRAAAMSGTCAGCDVRANKCSWRTFP